MHFFDDETQYWTKPNYSALEGNFTQTIVERRRFEVTPIYIYWQPSLERLRRYNPEAKLIFLFRDPFERAWSHWCMEFARGADDIPFSTALRLENNRLGHLAPLAPERRIYSYLSRGLYGLQIERALEVFPAKQILFLRSEDLFSDPVAVLRRLSVFLNLSPFPEMPRKWEFPRRQFDYPSTPTRSDLLFARDVLSDDMERFAARSGLDIEAWPSIKEWRSS
ncbi:MAG: sulfotransferase [Hyphomicrobiales bacterium]|nr:sulfotransferase [Hyphomicrobiales bacterium]